MAITQAQVLPQQYMQDLGRDYGQQLAGLTAVPLDTSQFAPQVAGQDPLQTQAASLASSGVGAYSPYLTQAATQGTQAISTLGGVSPYISAAGALTGTGAGTGTGSIASYMSPYQSQVIDATLSEFDRQAAARQQSISDQAVALGGYGGGREKADDVPARLSKNEFVFTADAVSAAGGGDIDEGAAVMERLMENLEAGGKVSDESQGLEGAQEMFANTQRLQNRII